MKLYLSGPMSGHPDFNRPAFYEAADRLEQRGYRILSPALIRIPGNPEWADWMKPALTLMFDADAICLLPDWNRSRGALLEHYLARELGMPRRTLQDWLDDPQYDLTLTNTHTL